MYHGFGSMKFPYTIIFNQYHFHSVAWTRARPYTSALMYKLLLVSTGRCYWRAREQQTFEHINLSVDQLNAVLHFKDQYTCTGKS